MDHTLFNFASFLTRYLPAYLFALIALIILAEGGTAIALITVFFILQIAYIVLIDKLPGSIFDKAQLDFAPPAAIVLAYYVSLPSALVAMMLHMVIFDIYSLEVSVFSELEDGVFTVIVAVLAALLRGAFDFLPLAAALIFVRYFVLVVVHGALTRDFNPRKFANEGISALVFIFLFRLAALVVGG